MKTLEFNEKYLMGRKLTQHDIVRGCNFLTPLVIPKIVCKDGFAVSVQASEGHYATPRNNEGPWCEVELGYPTDGDVRLTEYMDGDPDRVDPSDTVYGYVPLNIVLEVFEDHGGIDEGVTKHWSDI